MTRRLLALALLLFTQAAPADPPADKKPEAKDPEPPAPAVTHHTLNLPGGRTLSYQATAGYLTLRDLSEPKDSKPKGDKDKEDATDPPKGKAKAQVFFVAYSLEGGAPDPATRPVTFSFNGGPGASSVWLHMGALGPRRAQLTPLGEAPPPPYKAVDNESTWLDKTDLVFIDPVSTGYSRAATGEGSNQFHGYKEDLASVGEFIRLYLTHNARWASPKFIVGESYGTTRAAALSDYLQETHGIYLNGIALVSSVLDFQTIVFQPGNNLPYSLYLPSYAAAAWYHKRLPADLQDQPLAAVTKAAETFAVGDYALALAQGSALPEAERQRIAGQLARFTGLPAAYLAQLNLRERDDRFFTDLLKDSNRSIGRFDARYAGLRYAPGTEDSDFDPSYEAVNGAFTAAFNDYIRRELKYESDLPYNLITDVQPWNWSVAQNQFLNVAEDLRKAMSRHPYLQVWVCCGYYDLATPYFAAQHTINSMNLDPSLRANIRLTFYEAGHMLYVHQPSREKLKTDFDAFIDAGLHAAPDFQRRALNTRVAMRSDVGVPPITRRNFLRRSALLAAGGCAAGLAEAAAQGDKPLRLVFATDIHLARDNGLRSADGLAQCLRAIEALEPRPEFILCGGDLTQELPFLPLDAASKHFDGFLALWKSNTSLPTRWMLGNHDIAATKVADARRDDPRFGEGLFRERLGPTRHSFDAGAWHFVVLDDIVFDAAGEYLGEFNSEQLTFLREDLAAHADRPTVVCCHIPAVSVVPAMAHLAKSLGANIYAPPSLVTRDPKPFLAAIKQPQVKLVLSGHLHHLEQLDIGGIHFINGGAICGNWWHGPQAGCAEGFLVLDLQPSGAFNAKYETYGWTAVA